MRTFKEDPIYIVADIETGLVLTRVSSANCASALTLGLLNSTSISLPTQLSHRRNEWDAYDFNKGLFQVSQGYLIAPYPEELLREDLLKKREVAKIRGAFIYSLEVYCMQELTRIASYMPENLMVFIQQELSQCDPEKNIFTKAIEEYAALQEIEASVAYHELQLQLQSSGVVKLRNYAIYEKFMMKMNSCYTREELQVVHEQAFDALIRKAAI